MSKRDRNLLAEQLADYNERESKQQQQQQQQQKTVAKKEPRCTITIRKAMEGKSSEEQASRKVRETVKFPTERTGALIGRGGETIKALKVKFGVTLSVAEGGGSVDITGTDLNVRNAIEAVQAIVSPVEDNELEVALPSNDPRFPARKFAGEVGRTYHVRVMVDVERRAFLVTGSKQNVLLAKRALEKVVRDAEAMVTRVMEVPASSLKMIIGKGGSEIKRRQDSFRVRLECLRENPCVHATAARCAADADVGFVAITGLPTDIYLCRKDIEIALELRSGTQSSGNSRQDRSRTLKA